MTTLSIAVVANSHDPFKYGFLVQGLGFRVRGSRTMDLGFRVRGFEVYGLEFRVYCITECGS